MLTHITTRLGRHVFVCLSDQHSAMVRLMQKTLGDGAMAGWRGNVDSFKHGPVQQLTERGNCNHVYPEESDLFD
jgi:hypothetical protein